jgi:UrcA family protein
MSKTTHAAIASAVAIGGLALFGAMSSHASTVAVDSVVVGYSDLNLANATHAVALKQRIWNAANRVCGRPAAYNMEKAAEFRRCMHATTANAQAQVQWPVMAVADDR